MGFVKLLCYLNAQQDAGMAALASAALLAGAAASLPQAQGRGCSSSAGAAGRPGRASGLNTADSDSMLLGRAFSVSGCKKGSANASKDTKANSAKDVPCCLTGAAARDGSSVSRAGFAGGPGLAQVQPAAQAAAAMQTALVVQPQTACFGDLLKPFVIYLQVSSVAVNILLLARKTRFDLLLVLLRLELHC